MSASTRAGQIPVNIDTQTRPTFSWFLLQVGFFLTGVSTVLVGPILPALRSRFSASDTRIGTIFIAQFVGSSLGSLLSQVHCVFSVVSGFSLMAAGLAMLPFSSWPIAHLSIFLMGLGLGLAIPSTNMIVAGIRPATRAASLNILNLVWGAGAATCPLLVAVLRHWFGLNGALLVLAAWCGVVFVLMLSWRPVMANHAEPRPERPNQQRVSHLFPMAAFALLLFLYVGIETSIGGWAAAYAQTIDFTRPALQTLAVFCFWSALLGGRAVASLVLRALSEDSLYRISLIIAAAGMMWMIVLPSVAAVTLGAFVTAAGLAPLFALTLSLLACYAESHATRVPGWVFSLAGLGGAALPWLVGHIGTRFASLRYGLLVPAAATLLIFVVQQSSIISARELT